MRSAPILVVTLLLLGSLTAQKPSKEMAQVAAAYAAKITASAIFVSGRSLESVMEQELAPTRPLEAMIEPLIQFDIDRSAGTVSCSIAKAKATAVYRTGLGCVLVPDGVDIQELRAHDIPKISRYPKSPFANLNAAANQPKTSIDYDALKKAVDHAFQETDPQRQVHTRAVVVLHQGTLVMERYAAFVHKDMPLPGWSMSKTLTNTLIGMRVKDGKLDLKAPAIHHKGPSPQTAIPKVHHLLTMTAGLAWSEDYDDPNSEALRMLFRSTDHAQAYTSQTRQEAPGMHFQYASGATNQLCKILRRSFASDADYWRYPERLFLTLGMRTAVLETDPSGTFVGSSYCYASARDWARLGLLYARDGVCGNTRLLPNGWVQESTTAVPASSGRYGYHIWLNQSGYYRKWPDLPADIYSMDGHEGQHCVISPSAELIIVRLGCTKNGGFDLHRLLREVHAAVSTEQQKSDK